MIQRWLGAFVQMIKGQGIPPKRCDVCGWRHTAGCWIDPCEKCGVIHTGDQPCR
jgi:hypothetical protein